MLRVFEFMTPGTTPPSGTSPRSPGPSPRAASAPPASPRRLDMLHSDILRVVLIKLPILDLLSLTSGSKRLYQIASADAVWARFFPVGEPWPTQQLEIHGTWKKVYVAWLRRTVRAWRESLHWLKQPDDEKLKIAFFGPREGGKSALLTRFAMGHFLREYHPTIGVHFFAATVHAGTEEKTKLQMWDLTGSERFRFVCRNYYRGVRAGVFVYRATVSYSESELTMLDDFLAEPTVSENLIPLIVARTECDLLEQNQSNDRTRYTIETYVRKRFKHVPLIFIDVSAATGEGVAELGPLLVKYGREWTRMPSRRVTEAEIREYLERERQRKEQRWYSKIAGLVMKDS